MKKPAVTQLIDMLDKPALLRWANRQGLAGIDIAEERKRTKSLGSSMHEQIESRQFIDPEHARNFDRFTRDKEIVGLEGKIETEWFVGRYDAKIRWRGLTYLVDYKRSMSVYFETKLQLVAYAMAEPCDRLAVVSTPEFALMESGITDRSKYEQILIALSKIYTLRKQIEAGQ